MTAIQTALSQLVPGEPQRFANLEITPLLAATTAPAEYLTLTEAQEQGLAVVTEVSESGSVPTLLFENLGEQAVFLLDGEELVGAKQNRILNLSLLVPGNTRLEIPVSCVEQGRWRHRSREFTSTGRAHFSRGRARKAARVSESLAMAGVRESDQMEVWEDIRCKMSSLNVASETSAIADAYESFAVPVDEYVAAFSAASHQVGACFAINGQLRGVEVFDAPDTCAKLLPKLVRSYALDAIGEGEPSVPGDYDAVSDWLQSICEAPVDSFDALGEGMDLRLRSTGLAGGALAARGRVVHLCAFAQDA